MDALSSTAHSVSIFSANSFTAPFEMPLTTVVVVTATNLITMPFPSSTEPASSVQSPSTTSPDPMTSATSLVTVFVPVPPSAAPTVTTIATTTAAPHESWHTDVNHNAAIVAAALGIPAIMLATFVLWYWCHTRRKRRAERRPEWQRPVLTTLPNGRRVCQSPPKDATTSGSESTATAAKKEDESQDRRWSQGTSWSGLITSLREASKSPEGQAGISQPADAHLGRSHDCESGVFGAAGSPFVPLVHLNDYDAARARGSVISSMHSQEPTRDSSVSSVHEHRHAPATDTIEQGNPYGWVNPALATGRIEEGRENTRRWYGQKEDLPEALRAGRVNSGFARVESNPFQDQADIEMSVLGEKHPLYALPPAVLSTEAVRGSKVQMIPRSPWG